MLDSPIGVAKRLLDRLTTAGRVQHRLRRSHSRRQAVARSGSAAACSAVFSRSRS
jgi:hypothetical protein